MSSGEPVALVSGGSRGLGATLVRRFLDAGHRVATFSRSATPLVEELRESAGERFLWEAVDATDREAVRAFVEGAARGFGRLDVAVNNAGVGVDGLLATMRPDDVDRVLAVNLGCALHLARAASRAMLRQRGGTILNVSSIHGVRGHPGVAVYSATKAALDGLTRSLARELGPKGIRVNSVAPGYFESDMVAGLPDEVRDKLVRRTPLRRLVTVDDVAEVVLFLASERAALVTGQTIVVDGGFTC